MLNATEPSTPPTNTSPCTTKEPYIDLLKKNVDSLDERTLLLATVNENLNTKINANTSNISTVDSKVSTVASEIHTAFSKYDQKITEYDAKINIHTTSITNLKNEIAERPTKPWTIEEFNKLEKSKIVPIQNDLKTLKTDVTALQTAVEAMKSPQTVSSKGRNELSHAAQNYIDSLSNGWGTELTDQQNFKNNHTFSTRKSTTEWAKLNLGTFAFMYAVGHFVVQYGPSVGEIISPKAFFTVFSNLIFGASKKNDAAQQRQGNDPRGNV